MSHIIVKGRKWLNPMGHDDTGAVSYSVSLDDWGYVNAELSIWDCSRKIVLDLSYSDEKEALLRSKKIDLLIDALVEIERGMGIAYEARQLIDIKEDDLYD